MTEKSKKREYSGPSATWVVLLPQPIDTLTSILAPNINAKLLRTKSSIEKGKRRQNS
jgi:hypothetical protein